jgi:hypothetical protein
MYGSVKHKNKGKFLMDQSDIEYILELLHDAITNNDWDTVLEAKDTLKEFLDSDEFEEDE